MDSISSWFSRSISLSLSNGINGSAATDSIGLNRFFYDFVGRIRSAYLPLCGGKIKFRGWGRFFWVIFGGMGQKPCAEGHFAHRGRRGFGFCLGQPTKGVKCVVNGADWG